MKKILFSIILMIIMSITYAQVSINTDGSSPDASAILDVKSTSQGVLYPRMTNTQRDAISPVDGLTIFNTTTGCINYYYSVWYELCGVEANCAHTISLFDSYGDGWHGNNFLNVYVNGTLVLTNITLVSGSGPVNYTFSAGAMDDIQVTYTPGSWADECYYDFTDGTSALLVNDWYPNTTGTWNGNGVCPGP